MTMDAFPDTTSPSQELALVPPDRPTNGREFMPMAMMMRTYRATRGINQKALADEIGVSAAVISGIERGKSVELATGLRLLGWLFA